MAPAKDRTGDPAGGRPGGRRRLALPVDGSALDARHVQVDVRVGWLLRGHRLIRADPALATGRGAVERLVAAGVPCTDSTLSRWETGRQAVPVAALRAYEQVLGLPAGQLVAVDRGLRRALGDGTRPAASAPWDDADPAVLPTSRASGDDWLVAALRLTRTPGPPARGVGERVAVLLDEMVRSIGVAYLTRLEAMQALAADPRYVAPVGRAVGVHVTTEGAGSKVDALALLGAVADPKAVDTVLALLRDPSPGVVHAGLWALEDRLRRGEVDRARQQKVVETVVAVVACGPVSTAGAALALGVHLDDDLRASLAARVRPLRPTSAGDEEEAPVPELVPGAAAARWAVRAAGRATDAMGLDPDPMLARLLREAVLRTLRVPSHQASVLLMVSAYRAALVPVLLEEVASRASAPVRRRCLQLAGYLVDDADAPAVAAWAGDPDPEVAAQAVSAAAHAGALPVPEADLRALLDVPGTAEAVVYALGMTGHPLLPALAADPGVAPQVRSGARWWLRAGPAVRV